MPHLTEQLTIYLPKSVSLLTPEARAMFDRLLSNERINLDIQIINDERWLEMVK